MKMQVRYTRFFRLILIVVLGWGIFSCGKTTREEAIAQALQEEIQNLDNHRFPDDESWFNWQIATTSGWSARRDSIENAIMVEKKLRSDQIRQFYFQTDSIQKAIENRYRGQLEATLTLEKTERATLQQMASVIRQVLQKELRGNAYYEAQQELENLGHLMQNPYWSRGKDWTDTYLQHQPTYAALLHLETLKSGLTQVALALKQKEPDYGCGFPKLLALHCPLTDTLDAGENGRAILYLHGTGNSYFRGSSGYPYPKAFRINGSNIPAFFDLKIRDLVARIAIPTNAKSIKDSVVQKWSGGWVLALSPEKDTLIQTSGTYIIRPKR